MATNRLITKSLGSTELSSGQGTPDHVAPTGSLYTDTLTGKSYINVNGTSTGWELLQTPAFGQLSLTTNTTVTTISVANTWVSTNNLSGWTLVDSNGFTQTGTSSLLAGSNKGGRYLVLASGTLLFNAALAVYDLGVSVNELSPDNGSFNSSTVEATGYNRSISISSYIDINPGDTVSIVLRCATATNITLRHASLTLTKVY
jgi:hypothetical protein